MIWGKNKPVAVYESLDGMHIDFNDPQVKPALPITRGELIEHMRGVDYVFSKHDIKRGKVVLPPQVIAGLVSRPERSILEQPKPTQNVADTSRLQRAISVEVEEPTQKIIANTHTTVFAEKSVTATIGRYLERRKAAKEQALLDAEIQHETDLTSFYDTFPEATRPNRQRPLLRKLGVVVSGLCVSMVAVGAAAGPANAIMEQHTKGDRDPSENHLVLANLYAPYKSLGVAIERSDFNILK